MKTTRKRLVIVLTLNVLALVALAWSLDWVGLKSGESSNTTLTVIDGGGVGVGSATADSEDGFPPDPLPWDFTFDHRTEPPTSWIGTDRYEVRPADGGRVLCKESSVEAEVDVCLFGGYQMSNYAAQVDVRSGASDGELPDIGIICQGYILEMQGANQKLVVRGWAPRKTNGTPIDFAWEPSQWYVMKLKAEVEDGKAVLHAKVWPRDQEEPEQWNIDESHEPPNKNGCPGLFGRNPNAEIMFDNIKVTAN